MGGIFASFGNTWRIIKVSWRVLQLDRELIAFPILATLGAALVGLIAAGVFGAAGTFDRLGGGEAEFEIIDVIITLFAYFLGLFCVIFFNAALVAAARERLEGGDPNIRSGIRAVSPLIPQILGWTLITGTVGLILRALQAAAESQESGVARIVGTILISIVGAIWAYITFFVIPVLVVERVGPIAAIRRSSGLLKRTWGEQVAASFSFFFIYLIAVVIVAIPVVVLALIAPIAAIIAAVVLGGLALATVSAMEGIFKAALYEWVAEGKGGEWFDMALLKEAWHPR